VASPSQSDPRPRRRPSHQVTSTLSKPQPNPFLRSPGSGHPGHTPGRKANKALGGNVSPGKQVTLAQMFGRRSS
jgi:hypothetical protein